MLAYTYSCVDCGHVFNQRQKLLEDPLTKCPRCYNGLLTHRIKKEVTPKKINLSESAYSPRPW